MLREEEDEGAGLASVCVGDVEVEEGRDGWRDLAIVGCTESSIRLARVHGDNEVGEL